MHKYWMFGLCQRSYIALFALAQLLAGFITVRFGRKRYKCVILLGCSFLALLWRWTVTVGQSYSLSCAHRERCAPGSAINNIHAFPQTLG